jgi:hypothetical protein
LKKGIGNNLKPKMESYMGQGSNMTPELIKLIFAEIIAPFRFDKNNKFKEEFQLGGDLVQKISKNFFYYLRRYIGNKENELTVE